MFPEFGQSPLCLELDLDSYEESWTHVSAFRGQTGWLLLARATIQSEHDMLRATLIAACDEHENPIPAWRAEHLAQCRWDRLDHCHEEPPEILDDLLCEEEGALYARWQREMNSGLAALYDNAQRDIESLEAKATARTREVDLQIADLRRRRRMVEASDEARAAIAEIIAELEAEHDQAIAQLAQQRAALRRQADATEEALWQRTDVLIEVEPICLVRWRAKVNRGADRLLSPEHGGSGGISLLRVHRPEIVALERRREQERAELERLAEAARAAALEKQAAIAKVKKPHPASDAKPPRDGNNDLPKASPFLRKLAATTTAAPSAPAFPSAPSRTQLPMATKAPALPVYGKLNIERDLLVGMLEGLEEKGQRFFPGSRKYIRNQEERAELTKQIAVLDARIAAAAQSVKAVG
jgi:hypothetical protein